MVDENIHIDKPTLNQALLTGCSISGRSRCDGLGERMGNTANFKGGVLYASQSSQAIYGGLEKKNAKMRLRLPVF